MPVELKNNIRKRLIKIASKSEKKKIFTFRWTALPLAATSALVFFILIPWLGNISGSITWADVQKQLEQFRTMSTKLCAQIEAPGPSGQKFNLCSKSYFKDPLLRRIEAEVSESEGMGVDPGSNVTMIVKQEAGRIDLFVLNNGAQKAELQTWLFNTDDMRAPPFSVNFKYNCEDMGNFQEN
ncbi:MAG: hypothetical protein JW927_09145 [Deltaproteobacteria bacterium]|nr:hypothetical protein [Deltaproteobacteria bacterium]